jgi:hypothetical protein
MEPYKAPAVNNMNTATVQTYEVGATLVHLTRSL